MFLIGLSSCKWGLQIFIVWLVQKALFWLVEMESLWLISEDANEEIAVQLKLDGESLSLVGWNTIRGIPL